MSGCRKEKAWWRSSSGTSTPLHPPSVAHRILSRRGGEKAERGRGFRCDDGKGFTKGGTTRHAFLTTFVLTFDERTLFVLQFTTRAFVHFAEVLVLCGAFCERQGPAHGIISDAPGINSVGIIFFRFCSDGFRHQFQPSITERSDN